MEVKKKDEFKYGFIIPLIVAGTLIGIPFIMYSKLSLFFPQKIDDFIQEHVVTIAVAYILLIILGMFFSYFIPKKLKLDSKED